MEKQARDIILRPVVTDIKRAVEEIFKVKVVGVNTMRVKGKEKRMGRSVGKTSDWKKAIVELAAGDTIEVFEGM